MIKYVHIYIYICIYIYIYILVKRNPLFFHSISYKNNGFLFTIFNIYIFSRSNTHCVFTFTVLKNFLFNIFFNCVSFICVIKFIYMDV